MKKMELCTEHLKYKVSNKIKLGKLHWICYIKLLVIRRALVKISRTF